MGAGHRRVWGWPGAARPRRCRIWFRVKEARTGKGLDVRGVVPCEPARPGPSGTAPTEKGSQMGTPVTSVSTVPAVTKLNPNWSTITYKSGTFITGIGFTGATAVMFGTKPATSFTVWNDTQMVANAPAMDTPQTVDVTVTSPGGTSAAGPNSQFTFTNNVIATGPGSPVPPNTPYTYSVTIPLARINFAELDLTATLSGAAATFIEGRIEYDTVDTCTPSGAQITGHVKSNNCYGSDHNIVFDLTVLPTAAGTVSIDVVTT